MSVGEWWWRVAESLIQGRLKSYPFPGGILAAAISMTYNGMLHRLDISTFCLRVIAASDFRSSEIFKNLGLSLPTITFLVNSRADNHFYKYIYICFKYYTVWNQFFLIEVHVQVFYIQIWSECETLPLFFLLKAMVYRKNLL